MIPDWALTIIYWLHMVATVIWIGSLVILSVVILPAAKQRLSPSEYIGVLESIQKRLDPLAWFSLFILLSTGLVQMSTSPSYQGLLVIQGRWAIAILIKHTLFFAMGIISAYLTWWLLPELRRLAIQQTKGDASEDIADRSLIHHRREIFLLRVNLVLGIMVLALTAVARTS